jgi:tetratricopeptide (TPR) repeat protein
VQKALEQEGATAEEHNLLGVVQTRKEDYKAAIDSFRESLLMDPQDLTVRSNLAEAYLNAGLPDKAEEEYQKILHVTENHIEAQIGMGQVYLNKAEGKKEGSTDSTDPDFFDDAVHHFARAVELGKNEPCSASSRMKPKKWAGLYYSIGYTRVKMYSASKGVKDESLLRRALSDFKLCLKNDPEHYKARRAKKKIAEKLRPLSPERLMEKIGPAAIFLASTFVFAYTQFAFLHSGKISDPVLYSSLTFGSLVLMIAGLYLPRLLKLKVAGIELEKSTVDQITTGNTFEISK